MDRRTRYTKMVIQESLFSLLKTKPLSKITISDICKTAEISRPTFYLHYEDINALLDEIGENMITSAKLEEMVKLTIEDQDAIYSSILNLLRIIQDNMEIYRICAIERGVNSHLPNKISEAIQQTVIRKWEQDGMLTKEFDKQYIGEYIQASFNSIVYCWINKKENQESIETLSKLIERFLIYGLSGFAKESSGKLNYSENNLV